MARTTGEKVKDVFDTTLTAKDLGSYIEDANLFVTEVLGASALPAALLASIEKYIAAHFASATDPRVRRESNLSVEYEKPGLSDTSHGRRAVLLDTTGTLANFDDETGFGFLAKVGEGIVVDDANPA